MAETVFCARRGGVEGGVEGEPGRGEAEAVVAGGRQGEAAAARAGLHHEAVGAEGRQGGVDGEAERRGRGERGGAACLGRGAGGVEVPLVGQPQRQGAAGREADGGVDGEAHAGGGLVAEGVAAGGVGCGVGAPRAAVGEPGDHLAAAADEFEPGHGVGLLQGGVVVVGEGERAVGEASGGERAADGARELGHAGGRGREGGQRVGGALVAGAGLSGVGGALREGCAGGERGAGGVGGGLVESAPPDVDAQFALGARAGDAQEVDGAPPRLDAADGELVGVDEGGGEQARLGVEQEGALPRGAFDLEGGGLDGDAAGGDVDAGAVERRREVCPQVGHERLGHHGGRDEVALHDHHAVDEGPGVGLGRGRAEEHLQGAGLRGGGLGDPRLAVPAVAPLGLLRGELHL